MHVRTCTCSLLRLDVLIPVDLVFLKVTDKKPCISFIIEVRFIHSTIQKMYHYIFTIRFEQKW